MPHTLNPMADNSCFFLLQIIFSAVSISNISSVGFGASPEKMRPDSCRLVRWESGRSACHTNWSSAESFTCDILIAPSLMAYFTTLHKIF